MYVYKIRILALPPLGNRGTVFLRSDATATIYFVVCLVRLLFEGGVYSRAASDRRNTVYEKSPVWLGWLMIANFLITLACVARMTHDCEFLDYSSHDVHCIVTEKQKFQWLE